MKILYKSLSIAVLFVSINTHAQEHGNWGYEGVVGPNFWSQLDSEYHVCGDGRNQSPIDLHNIIDAELPDITIDYRSSLNEVVNNGHTIQVNAQPGSTIEIGQIDYELIQLHFHSPSENSINGQSYPMEIHFVHKDKNNNLAVLAVMVSEGQGNNTLRKVWDKMPSSVGARSHLEIQAKSVNLIPEDHTYFRYNGSLTTPPCSEGVTWLVLKNPIEASKTQIDQFKEVLHHPNNRPQQFLGARVVLE